MLLTTTTRRRLVVMFTLLVLASSQLTTSPTRDDQGSAWSSSCCASLFSRCLCSNCQHVRYGDEGGGHGLNDGGGVSYDGPVVSSTRHASLLHRSSSSFLP